MISRNIAFPKFAATHHLLYLAAYFVLIWLTSVSNDALAAREFIPIEDQNEAAKGYFKTNEANYFKTPVEGRNCYIYYPFKPVPENLTVKYDGPCNEYGWAKSSQFDVFPLQFFSNGKPYAKMEKNVVWGNAALIGGTLPGRAQCSYYFDNPKVVIEFTDGEVWEYSCDTTDYNFQKIRETSIVENKNKIAEKRQQAAWEAEQKRKNKEFSNLQTSNSPRAMYLGAVNYEDSGDRGQAKTIYRKLIKRFPESQEALLASQRLTKLSDVEAIESSNSNTANAAYQASENVRNANYQQCMNEYGACYSRCDSFSGSHRSSCMSSCVPCAK